MKLEPLKQWICDSCGGIIESSEDGWWEYCDDLETEIVSGFRIVHHQNSCMYNEKELRREGKGVGDLPLGHMLESGGFGHLLHRLELSVTKKTDEHIDIPEFIENIRRLYLPYWEEARQYWEVSFKDGFHDGCDFSENSLISIIEEYSINND